jgi:hypothetical protein
MKKKKSIPFEDGDDAHFSDNPRVPKKRGTKKKMVKSYAHSSSFNRVYGEPQKAPKKTTKKRVFVKQ